MSSPNQLSFLPDDYLERKARRRMIAIGSALSMIVILSVGAGKWYSDRSVQASEIANRDINERFVEAAKRIELVQQMQDKQRQMAQQAELTASLLEKIPRSYLLGRITNALPAGVSLLDLDMKSTLKRAPAPVAKTALEQKRAAKQQAKTAAEPKIEAKVYDVTMKITGMANSDVHVAQFISVLNQDTLFRDVNLLISDEFIHEGQTLRKFSIEVVLNPDVQIDPTEQPAKKTGIRISDLRDALLK